jgi:formylglycine-generating enzyme required for sulfatase activity
MINMKFLFQIIFVFLNIGGLYAQNKKEQIVLLLEQIDSIEGIVQNERDLYQNQARQLNFRIDSMILKATYLSSQLEKLYNEFDKINEDFTIEESRNQVLKSSVISEQAKNNKLRSQIDSLLNTKFGIDDSIDDLEMVFVKGGAFKMGCASLNGRNMPIHNVTLKSYYIGKYEITQGHWQAIMGSNPSHFNNCDKCPVESVSWDEVQEFIRKLNLKTSSAFRLPTEAEWEFAAIGGRMSQNYLFSGSNSLDFVGWHEGNSNTQTHAVGQKAPNELGVYDMTGNVEEFCSDWLGDYSNINAYNPKGKTDGLYRITRGGSFPLNESSCPVKNWGALFPNEKNYRTGFRLVRSAE